MTDSATDEKPKKPKTNEKDFLFKKDFRYKHDNPYHDKLAIFDKFVLRDDEGESFAGNWNQKVFENDAPIEVEIGSGYGHFNI